MAGEDRVAAGRDRVMTGEDRRLAGDAARRLRRQAHGLGTSLGLVRRFAPLLAGHRRPMATALGASLAYTAASLAEPWPLKLILDHVLPGKPLATGIAGLDAWVAGGPTRLLGLSAAVILVLAALRGSCYYQRNVHASRVGHALVTDVRRQLFAHMQRLSLRFHHQHATGDLLTRLTGDIALLRELMVASIVTLLSEGIILVGYVAVMLVMAWELALVSLVAMPVIFVLLTVYSGRIRAAARKQRRAESKLAARAHEVLAGIHVVQAFAREDAEDAAMGKLAKRSLKSSLTTTRLEAGLNRSVELAIAAATAVAMWFGVRQVLAGELTAGDLVVFVAYMKGFYRPLRRISQVAERGSKAGTCIERVTEVLDRLPEVPDGREPAPALRGAIHFDGVDFGYAADQPVLRGIDLRLEPGQTVALVGPSGAGKTTLLSLIPRFFDPAAGAVRVDGHDLRRFTLRSLREQVALVPQDGMLFAGTIRDNIAYGRPGATDAEIEAAARAAGIHAHIASLPGGYDAAVGERGVTLSGGQRQRLAIARALVRDAPIVLLDEPTTGLDAEAEAQVLAAMDRLLAGRTAVVIAHRLATVRRADRIVVLEGGRVVGDGTHDDLMAGCPLYRDLYTRQLEPAAAGEGAGEGKRMDRERGAARADAPPAVDAVPIPAGPAADGGGRAAAGRRAPRRVAAMGTRA